MTKYAYILDECWWMEIATGRGSLHLHLPVDRILSPPPEFYSLQGAPPWWHIWSHMEVTYPPLYPTLLRGWISLFGSSDYQGRLFSTAVSLVAVAIFFDIVRLQSRLGVAVWAGLLMALATPQVEHAQLARGYTLLIACALAAVNMVVRIQRFGSSRRRLILLSIAVLATLMTHYFCIGAMLALLGYCMLCLPAHRRGILLAFAAAGFIFTISWGPMMWQQRHLFSTDDVNTAFLNDKPGHHLSATLIRIMMDPGRMLFEQSEKNVIGIFAMVGGIALCAAPLVSSVRKKNPFVLLWTLWIIGTVAVVAGLDLSRGTRHLGYIRYTLLIGPAVYALIPLLLVEISGWNFIGHLVSALIAIGCALHVPEVYDRIQPDLHEPARDLITKPGPDDLLIFASTPMEASTRNAQLLMFSRYLEPSRCPLLVMDRPADPGILEATRQSRYIFISTQHNEMEMYLPGAHLIRARGYPAVNISTMQMKSR